MAKENNRSFQPLHVALIMDGNGRWALRQKMPRHHGHRVGAETLRNIVSVSPALGIRFLTVFAFSTENWRREPEEVNGLMSLMHLYSNSMIKELQENGVEVEFIGDLTSLDRSLKRKLETLQCQTSGGLRLKLTVAVNYGGRAELTRAVQKIASCIKNGKYAIDEIDEQLLQRHLMTANLPDPDLIIRTGGDVRISNFLLWQSAYTEFEFVDTLWPDFTPDLLRSIVAQYPTRSRRFGATGGVG